MSTYQINLLLEALVGIYSIQELIAAEPVVLSLVNHLGFDCEQAEAFVAGALQLKEARARLRDVRQGHLYVQ